MGIKGLSLGCCSCDEEISSSSLSSVSESVIVSEGTTDCSPDICLNDIYPLKYRITVSDPGGSSNPCASFFYGTFILRHVGSGCPYFWSALDTTAITLTGPTTCSSTPGSQARYSLIITNGGFPNNTNFGLQALTGGTAWAAWSLNTGTTPNCVASFGLTKTSTDTWVNFPASVVIVPV